MQRPCSGFRKIVQGSGIDAMIRHPLFFKMQIPCLTVDARRREDFLALHRSIDGIDQDEFCAMTEERFGFHIDEEKPRVVKDIHRRILFELLWYHRSCRQDLRPLERDHRKYASDLAAHLLLDLRNDTHLHDVRRLFFGNDNLPCCKRGTKPTEPSAKESALGRSDNGMAEGIECKSLLTDGKHAILKIIGLLE